MKVKIAFSKKQTVGEVIEEIKSEINSFVPKTILFFSSPTINPQEISKEMYAAFNQTPTFGCTTSGELISGQMLDNSTVVMAMGEEIIADCKIEVLENIKTDTKVVDKAFASFEKKNGIKMSTLDTKKYVGIVLIDGLSSQEEKINERIGDLTNVSFLGGSAGDNQKFENTFVFANGKTYTNAAVLALLDTNNKFEILKTQSFKSTGKKLLVTNADEENRTVLEFNGNPAKDEFAKTLGKNKDNIEDSFPKHPIGLGFDGNFFIRSQMKTEGENIKFYCSMKNGMELEILEAQDIVEHTQKDLDIQKKNMGNISAIINFNCLFRTLELKAKNQTEAYAKIFEQIPTIGFSTYGESYIGHMNQTAVMLLFK